MPNYLPLTSTDWQIKMEMVDLLLDAVGSFAH